MLLEKNMLDGNVYEVPTMDSGTKVKIGVNPLEDTVPFSIIVTEEADHLQGRLLDRFTGFSMNKKQFDELLEDLSNAKKSYEEEAL